jgi:hypothetical protein
VRIAHRHGPPSHTILYPNSKKRKEIFNGVPRAITDFVKNLLSGLVLILGIRIASAQAVSIGIKGGIPIGGTIGQQDESRPYIVGPSVEVRLPAGFVIEVDALYRPSATQRPSVSRKATLVLPSSTASAETTGNFRFSASTTSSRGMKLGSLS